MKKVTTLMSLFFVTIFISSCEKETNPVVSNEPLNIDYSQIGELHNEGLAFIYEDLKSSKDQSRKLSKNNLLDVVEGSTNSYMERISKNEKELEISRTIISKMNDQKKSSIKTSINDLPLTDFQKANIQKMNDILDSEGSFKTVKDQLNNLQIEIQSSTNSIEEKEIVIIAVTVASYSLDYWNENVNGWIELNGENAKYSWSDLGSDLLDMAKYDAGGAVVGAVAGAGVLSAPGAVAGASYASAAEGVVKFIESF